MGRSAGGLLVEDIFGDGQERVSRYLMLDDEILEI